MEGEEEEVGKAGGYKGMASSAKGLRARRERVSRKVRRGAVG